MPPVAAIVAALGVFVVCIYAAAAISLARDRLYPPEITPILNKPQM